MKIKAEYIIFGIVGLVVLYALTKLRAPEPQVVTEFVGSPQAQGNPQAEFLGQARASAFQSVANLAQGQIQADLGRYTTDAQLKATEIAARTQESLGMAQLGSRERMQAADLATQRELGLVGFDLQRFLAEVQERLGLAGLDTQESLYMADLGNRLAQQRQQIEAINQAAVTFRNQSLERQGTILNALSGVFGAPAPYNYQSAFGGPRPPGFFSPGGGFSQIAQLAGGFFGF